MGQAYECSGTVQAPAGGLVVVFVVVVPLSRRRG